MRLTKRVKAITVAILAAAGLGLVFMPTSGADFTASDTGSITAQTGNLSLNLSDGSNTGTFALNFANLKPGDSKTASFTVKNTGSIAAKVSLDQPITNAVVPNIGAAELAKMRVGVDNYAAPAPVTSLTSGFNLGALNAGQSRTYTVRVELDSSAGNVWQDRTVSATGTVWLKQS